MTHDAFIAMLRTAAMQVRLASHLYRGRKYIARLALQVGAHSLYVERGHITAAALVFKDHVHVSIGGTDDLHDWVQNLSARQVSYQGFQVHEGFAEAAGEIEKGLIAHGLRSFTNDRDIVLGGHSAGGAIAELLALKDWIEPREVVTFGAPRVLASGSAATYRAEPWHVYRFVSGGDPVPGLPLRKFRCMFGRAQYSHASAPMELTADGRILMDQEISTLRKLVRVFASAWLYVKTAGALSAGRIAGIAENHSVETYAKRITESMVRYRA